MPIRWTRNESCAWAPRPRDGTPVPDAAREGRAGSSQEWTVELEWWRRSGNDGDRNRAHEMGAWHRGRWERRQGERRLELRLAAARFGERLRGHLLNHAAVVFHVRRGRRAVLAVSTGPGAVRGSTRDGAGRQTERRRQRRRGGPRQQHDEEQPTLNAPEHLNYHTEANGQSQPAQVAGERMAAHFLRSADG